MVEETFDVVLQSTGWFDGSLDDWENFPPPQGNFSLESDLWLGKLPHKIKSAEVFDACEPAGFNFRPIRQFGCRYALCRRVYPSRFGRESLEWDHDGVIGIVLFLSRLIHPTTIAPQYSARLFFENGILSSIVPGRVHGYGTHVWIVARQWRDWLGETEAEKLRGVIPRYIGQTHERVRRARSHIDHAFHAFYVDQRTASIVSSFESLLKIERNRATAQFALRVPALAKMVGLQITPNEAQTLYEERSVFVHGRAPNYEDVDDELIARYNKFEAVLRCALLQASTDVQFCDLFASDATVASAFGSLP